MSALEDKLDDCQNDDDQTDEIDNTAHVRLLKLFKQQTRSGEAGKPHDGKDHDDKADEIDDASHW